MNNSIVCTEYIWFECVGFEKRKDSILNGIIGYRSLEIPGTCALCRWTRKAKFWREKSTQAEQQHHRIVFVFVFVKGDTLSGINYLTIDNKDSLIEHW